MTRDYNSEEYKEKQRASMNAAAARRAVAAAGWPTHSKTPDHTFANRIGFRHYGNFTADDKARVLGAARKEGT